MRAALRAIDRLSDVLAVVAAILLIAAALVITYSVVYRALGNSTYWELEFSVYMMVASLFLASPYTLKTRGHVGVDLLSHFLPVRARRALAIVVAAVGLLVCLYLSYLGAELTYESFGRGERTESTWRPYKWPLFLMMPLGLALTALQYAVEFFRPSIAQGGADE